LKEENEQLKKDKDIQSNNRDLILIENQNLKKENNDLSEKIKSLENGAVQNENLKKENNYLLEKIKSLENESVQAENDAGV
jgi:FtsZ-binding cell division protein ZapB